MQLDDAIFAALVTDAAGRIGSWNAACEELFGRSARDALGHPLSELLAGTCHAQLDQRWNAFPHQCDAQEISLVRPDGVSRRAALTMVPMYGADGALCGSIAFFEPDDGESDTAMVRRMPLSSVIDVLPGTFYLIRPDGSFALWNRTLEQVTGMNAQEVGRANALDMYDGTEQRIIAGKMREVFEENDKVFVEANYLDKYGNGTPYLLCGARISCRGHVYLCGMGLDITQRRAQEETLRLRERALHATSSGLVITRCDGKDNPIEYVNPAFTRISGYRVDEAIGRDSRFMAAAGLDEDQRDRLRAAIRERREVNVVMRNRRKNGEIFWNDLTITPVSDERGKVSHFIGVINDVTAIKQRTAYLEHEVNHDPLTGLANRNLMWDRLEQAILMAQRHKSLVATVLIDLDGFKQINDSYGHEAGDEVLTAVAKRLQASVRESDTVARLSGDEFVLVLSNQPSLRYTMRMIDRLKLAMRKPVAFEHTQIEVGASMGVSVYPHDGASALDLVRAADAAMYHAKGTKKNEAHFFSPDMRSTTEAKQQIENGLRQAIDGDQLFLLFQPKICLRSGRIQGLEALLRWRHPEKGVLAPAAFLPEAEENGLIIPIGNFVLEQVCAFLQDLRQRKLSTPTVAVNTSYREFSRSDYVAHVSDMLSKYSLVPADLELELREQGLNGNHHLGIAVLSQLRDLGVQRSVDAFGDGVSNLNFLKQLPLTHVKMAKVAVHQITAEANSGVVAKALIDIGHDLGFRVIAKAVETRVQMEFLRANDCDEMQGMYYSVPLPAGEAMELLTRVAEEAVL